MSDGQTWPNDNDTAGQWAVPGGPPAGAQDRPEPHREQSSHPYQAEPTWPSLTASQGYGQDRPRTHVLRPGRPSSIRPAPVRGLPAWWVPVRPAWVRLRRPPWLYPLRPTPPRSCAKLRRLQRSPGRPIGPTPTRARPAFGGGRPCPGRGSYRRCWPEPRGLADGPTESCVGRLEQLGRLRRFSSEPNSLDDAGFVGWAREHP